MSSTVGGRTSSRLKSLLSRRWNPKPHDASIRKMASVPEPFSYNAALVGRRIRLLRISPSSGANTIRLSLSEEELDSDTPYLALSYVWGSPEATKTVICNEMALNITENLHAALWQMREDGRTGYVWADAVCINQEDAREKTEQVRLMSFIYERAEMVLIWLGEGEKHDQEGYALMARLCEPPQGPETFSLLHWVEEFSESDAFSAMLNLLRRPWFWRAWVVQEYLLARKKIFQSGNLIMAADPFSGIGVRFSRDPNMILFIQLIYQLESGYITAPVLQLIYLERGRPLSELLAAIRSLKSSDKRDRIFALVGLSSDTDLSLIDYGLDLQDILLRVAKESTQKRLEGAEPWLVLDALCSVNSPGGVENLPSWVPDYELPAPFRNLTGIPKLETPLDTAPQVEFTAENTMVIVGRVFDRVSKTVQDDITDLTELSLDLISITENSKRFLAWESSARGLAASITTYPTGENLQEAYVRSLVFNSAFVHGWVKKASSGIREAFNAWMKGAAISSLLADRDLGRFVPESFEDVLSQLRNLAPNIDWHLSLESVPAMLNSRMWDELKEESDQCGLILSAFSSPISLFGTHRRYFVSELGHLGWVPCSAQEGDRICAFYGCRFPFVIRPKGNGFQLIGACFMYGIMEGEAIKLPNTEGDERDISITLV